MEEPKKLTALTSTYRYNFSYTFPDLWSMYTSSLYICLMLTIKSVDLIKSFNTGDPMAFKVIFDHYYKMLCSFTYNYIRTPYAVDDIVQDLFVHLWNKRENFDSIEKINSFLYVSARNACLNYLKHEQMKAKKLKEMVAQRDDVVFNDHIIKAEFDRMLNQWLNSLPEECRKIVNMAISGMKNDEIAKALNISVNTVKNQKVKGFKILKELYKNEHLTILLYVFLSTIPK